MSIVRSEVTVYGLNGPTATVGQMAMPGVFGSPIRPDLVNFVHAKLALNARQPYAVSRNSGYQTSAESWGTGRAVARIPRVGGGGTHRSGQGAFGNMCRGGGMFSPTKTYRRWFRSINIKERRYAICSALAASSVPSLVMAKGHKVEQVPEMPLVLCDDLQKLKRTAEATKVLESFGMKADLERCRNGKSYRSTKGSMRNRRWVHKRGPLVVVDKDEGVSMAMRAIPGVDVVDVNCLNILELCPGGRLGRMTVFSKAAMEKLTTMYGVFGKEAPLKKGFYLPRAQMANADVTRILHSREVQAAMRAPIEPVKYKRYFGNGWDNEVLRQKLNPAWNPTTVKK